MKEFNFGGIIFLTSRRYHLLFCKFPKLLWVSTYHNLISQIGFQITLNLDIKIHVLKVRKTNIGHAKYAFRIYMKTKTVSHAEF